MGREVRKVPCNWQHPKDEQGQFEPLYGGSFAVKAAAWDAEKAKWDEGLITDFYGGWRPRSECESAMACASFEEWTGGRPDSADYMPDWPEAERTHYMMYEDTSEGTPISSAFATPEELARWLAYNMASAMGNQTATYEQWLRVCNGGYAPSMVVDKDGIRSGVAL